MAKWRECLQELADLQRQILAVIWRYVKPGGYLLYSTCTINPAENDDNFRWIQENYPFRAVDIRPWLPQALQTESAAGGSLQLLPGVHDSDGFYLTALQRIVITNHPEKGDPLCKTYVPSPNRN